MIPTGRASVDARRRVAGEPAEIAMKTLGEIEAAICEGITCFAQDYMGRGPKEIRAHVLGKSGSS